MVRDFILTQLSHSPLTNDLRPALDQPGDGIDELPMRKHCDVLGGMVCESSQESLGSGYKF
ncbi:Unknown protein sequence [Pseudomonas amygdali pv. lachrymans]|uniref:Uncharacterized protein n=1 Tax=Pseudomonas amygdali pv. lachrymans TaxID=53707 RepID=A0ABR5L0S7_PSEAV|nr:Unknown protein sequence [Pseudomonas amygdali pv. lachrymans]KPC21962.1 Unknown protein sequence [Pseudomonas amygdali pv. lachrymans]